MDYQSCYNNTNQIPCIDKMPLTMSYTPMQRWGNVYDLETGLRKGTIFPDLYKPFYGAGGKSCCR